MKQKISEKEVEVLNAMKVLARYRAQNNFTDFGFWKVAILIECLMDIALKPFRCKKCGAENQLYGIRKQ